MYILEGGAPNIAIFWIWFYLLRHTDIENVNGGIAAITVAFTLGFKETDSLLYLPKPVVPGEFMDTVTVSLITDDFATGKKKEEKNLLNTS